MASQRSGRAGVPTISDVARLAEVSPSTASRALSGRRPVSAAVRGRVLDAVDQLGYRPNALARSLRVANTTTIGMVVPHISNPYFPGLVEAIERQLQTAGYDLLLCDSQGQPTIEAARINALMDKKVDGLLLVPCHSQRSSPAVDAASSRLPVIQIDRQVDDVETDFVGVDNEAGIRDVIGHLAERGAQSFAFVGADDGSSSSADRLRAYEHGTRDLHDGSKERVILGEFTVNSGREAVASIREAGALPDAIVCSADIIGLGVLHQLNTDAIPVPGRTMVTGFDDVLFSAFSVPPLTTVQQPTDALGAAAVRALVSRIADAARMPTRTVFDCKLVVRESSDRRR